MIGKEVSSNRLIKDGFAQAYFIDDQYEVLLSTIEKGTGLDLHHHDHIQFGYCFSGSFKFKAGEQWEDIQAGSSYLLASAIPHCADAVETFYAIDYKYNGPIVQPDNRIFRDDVFPDQINIDGILLSRTTVGNADVIKISGTGKIPLHSCFLDPADLKRIFVTTSGEIGVAEDDSRESFYPMKVYEIPKNHSLYLKLANDNVVCILLGIR